MASYIDPNSHQILVAGSSSPCALFLDRDGVINKNHGYVHRAEDTEFVPGIFELCKAAASLGYLLIVATNQAGIARGYYSSKMFLAYTQWLHGQFSNRGTPLLATYYCPHHPTEGLGKYCVSCDCRKPRPGMLLAAAERFGIDLGKSIMVGDAATDMESAITAGVSQKFLLQIHAKVPEKIDLAVPTGVRIITDLRDVVGFL